MTQTEVLPVEFTTDTLPDRAVVSQEKVPEKSAQKRLAALDTFRGLTIFLMLLVNNVALDTQTPPQLVHAKWNLGLQMADMVFPWFLFCVGVALPYSYASFEKSGKSHATYMLKALVRGGALVVIGALLDSAINHQLGFSLGVLQLIGLAYFVAAVAYQTHPWLRVLFGSVLLIAYGFALQHISFPGGPAGTLEESNNLIRHVNNTYLSQYNLQGLLSAIPTAGLVLYGTLMGDVLRHRKSADWLKLTAMIVSGFGLIAVGDMWSVFLPYNKAIWTPSYLMVAGGMGAIILAAFFLIVDIGRQKWLAFPFIVFGSNAIAAYVVPVVVKVMILELWIVQTPTGNMSVQKAILEWLKGNYGNVPGGWAYTGGYILIWWLVLWALYRKRWFLRV